MTIRLSTGARNALAQNAGFARIFNKGSIEIYSGSQPLNADAAINGTLLGVVTVSSGSLTKETKAVGTLTLATGAAGSINSVTVGTLNIMPEVVPYNISLQQTASDVADAINRYGMFQASASGAIVSITPWAGGGTSFNSAVVAATATTLTTSATPMASGVAPVNGLSFGMPTAGVIGKPLMQPWSFVGVATGTAGWFRVVASTADAGAIVTAAPWLHRLDGSIATSGADLNLSNISIAVGVPATIDTFNFTIPAQ